MCIRQVLTSNKFALVLEGILFCSDIIMKLLKYTSYDHQCFYYEDAFAWLLQLTHCVRYALPSQVAC